MHGRAGIVLGVTNLEDNDALLALRYDVEKDAFEGKKSRSMPMKMSSMMSYIEGATDETLPKGDDKAIELRDEYFENYQEDVLEVFDDYSKWIGSLRDFLLQDPKRIYIIEGAYNLLRRTEYQQTFGTEATKPIDENTEYKLLPVVSNVKNIEPVSQPKTAQFVRNPLQFKKIKDKAHAEAIIKGDLEKANAPRDVEGLIEAALNGEYGEGNDRWANADLLRAALTKILNGLEVEDLLSATNLKHHDRLTEAQWEHIAKGEVVGKSVVGYHWTGLENKAVAIGSGEKTHHELGTYKQAVEPQPAGSGVAKKD